MDIYVNEATNEYLGCPVRSDLNTCGAEGNSPINSCPNLGDDGIWRVWDNCPLKNEDILIKLKK